MTKIKREKYRNGKKNYKEPERVMYIEEKIEIYGDIYFLLLLLK